MISIDLVSGDQELHTRAKISIVIPTYNSERTLPQCLDSIKDQDYPRDQIEIIIADGGSTDRTLEIARKHTVKVLSNPRRTGEAGKSVGAKAAESEIIAFIDSDNILPSRDWLKMMVEPFDDLEIAAAEPLYYTYRRGDPLITRYCALMGMNDILCLYLGNYDRYNKLTGRWTDMNVTTTNRNNYLLVELNERNIPTIGANGFLVRADALRSTELGPYLFDIDLVYQLVIAGWRKYAKVKIGIIHLFANSVQLYAKKTRRRITDYLNYQRLGVRKYPWSSVRSVGLPKFLLYTLTIAPLLMTSLRGYRKLPDRAWLFHPLACWLTLLTYTINYLVTPRSRDSVTEEH